MPRLREMCPLQCPLPAGKEFPNSFESLVKKICRYLFHVLAHIYWAHFKETVALDLHGHLNTLYAHFIVFVREFNLVDTKETCIMDDLSEVLCTPLPFSPQQNHVTER